MTKVNTNLKKDFQSAITIIAWAAVFLQLFLIIENRVASIPGTIVRFFSFFTVQSNILVAVCFTFLRLMPNSKLGLFFGHKLNITAITLYILIVGIVYNLILRFLWQPTGLQRIDDEMLHSLIPILVLVYWIWFVEKAQLFYKHILPWLIFLSLFLVYTLIRGYFFKFYPYPFLNVLVLGYKSVLINSFFMVLAFSIIGSILVFISKIKK